MLHYKIKCIPTEGIALVNESFIIARKSSAIHLQFLNFNQMRLGTEDPYPATIHVHKYNLRAHTCSLKNFIDFCKRYFDVEYFYFCRSRIFCSDNNCLLFKLFNIKAKDQTLSKTRSVF